MDFASAVQDVTGNADLFESDTKSLRFGKIATDPCDISSDGTIARNMRVSLDNDKPYPLTIEGLHSGQADSFWSSFQYKKGDQDELIVGLHWVLDPDQAKVLAGWVGSIGLNRDITEAQFITNLQRLREQPAFHGHGHVNKLLSLFTKRFHMGTDTGNPFELEGFGDAEKWHRWTAEEESLATLRLDSGNARPKRITFLNTSAYVPKDQKEQEVEVLFYGIHVGTYIYQSDQAQEIKVDIPPYLTEAKIAFKIPGAASPGGGDNRKLGLALRDVQFEY